MTVWDWICGRKNVNTFDAEGLRAAVELIKQFEGATFLVKDACLRYAVYDYSEMQAFLTSLPTEFTFRSQIKTYNDRSGRSHLKITLKGSIGLCSQFNRYNLLNRTYVILASSCDNNQVHIANEAKSE